MKKNILAVFSMFMLSVVSFAQTTLISQSFEQDSLTGWNYSTDPAPFNVGTDKWDTLKTLSSNLTTMPSDSSYFWGVQDLANSTNGGTATGDSGTIDFSYYTIPSTATNVAITFDYDVYGFDLNDDVDYEVFEDGVSKGIVNLVIGANNGGTTKSGTEAILIGAGTDSVAIKVYVTQNGGNDFAGFDNFKVVSNYTSGSGSSTSIPNYGIATVTTEDANGVADSLNVNCAVSGIVYGVDMSGTVSSSNGFTVIDGTGGIAVYKAGGFTPVYTVTEGDSVTLYGKITQFNGLTQFTPDSIKKHKGGVALKAATKVSKLGENTESDLIKVDSVQVIDPSQWPSVGNNANVQIETTKGDTLTMRIDRDTDVDDSITVAPTGYFHVIGIGGQFDVSNPYTSGYQILPRYKSDIVLITGGGSGGGSTPGIPHYPIGTVTTEDANGVADSLTVKCAVSGIVYGVDLSGTGSSSNTFTVIDATGGVAVYKGGGFTPAYTVTETDSVTMYGRISQFNGLTQFSPDSIKLHKTGAALKTPVNVFNLGEGTESDLIKVDSVKVIDPSQWPAIGSNANVRIETTKGDTLTMRIDKDTEVEDSIKTAPVGYFSVTGIGGQFDNSNPYTSGYQILPRYKSDIFIMPLSTCNDPANLAVTQTSATDVSLTWSSNSGKSNIEYGTTGFVRGSGAGTVVTNVTGPYTVSGLTVGTTYDFYYQDTCAGIGTSNWVGPVSFTMTNKSFAIPVYPIATIATVDAGGVADSNGVECATYGIVVSKQFSEAGASGPDVQFVVTEGDNSDGITAISFSDSATLGYTPAMGDSVKLFGTVGQFRGLIQFNLDSVQVVSKNNTIPTPYAVDTVSEADESRLFTIKSVFVADPSQWPAVGSDANVQIVNTKGDTVTMRIDRHTDVAAKWPNAPVGTFNLIGVGGQYSFTNLDGYQVFPRIFTDIDTNKTATCADPSNIKANNVTATTAEISWTTGGASKWNIKWAKGMVSKATDSTMGITTNPHTLTGLVADSHYHVWVQDVCASSASNWVGPFMFSTIADGIEALNNQPALVVYPNPNHIGTVHLSKASNVTIRNLLGQPVIVSEEATAIDVSGLDAGLYILETLQGDSVKLIIK